MKKNKAIVLSGLLISSFCVDASQKSPATLPAKLDNSEHRKMLDLDLVSNIVINNRNFSDSISELKSLPTEIKFYKKCDENDNLFGQNIEISQELKDKYIGFVQSSYHDALETKNLIKENTGFKEVVLYVDLDEEDKIVRMIAEFIHKSRMTSSFAKEF